MSTHLKNNTPEAAASELVRKAKYAKPKAIPAKKAPNGLGGTKGDILMRRLATEFKLDPIKELIKLAHSDEASPELRFKIMNELLGYYMPKVKAIDTNPNQGEVINVQVLMPN